MSSSRGRGSGGYYDSGYDQGAPEEYPVDEYGLSAADQADIEAAMREGTHANVTGHYSYGGRWIGTSTEAVDAPPDEQPRLPGDEDQNWTHYRQHEDISPPRRAGGRARNSYDNDFQRDAPLTGFAQYKGTDDQGMSTYDYRRMDGSLADAHDVSRRQRNHDRWATSKSLDGRMQDRNQQMINDEARQGGYLPPIVHQPYPPYEHDPEYERDAEYETDPEYEPDPPQDRHRHRRRRYHHY